MTVRRRRREKEREKSVETHVGHVVDHNIVGTRRLVAVFGAARLEHVPTVPAGKQDGVLLDQISPAVAVMKVHVLSCARGEERSDGRVRPEFLC